MLGSLMKSRNSFKLEQRNFGQASVLGSPIQILDKDRLKINNTKYKRSPEEYKPLSSTRYDGKNMKKLSDILKLNSMINAIGYTGFGDKLGKLKKFPPKGLPKKIETIENHFFSEFTNESVDLQGEGVKIIIPSKISDIWTILVILLGLKLSGHTDILTEAGNLKDEIYRKCEIQN